MKKNGGNVFSLFTIKVHENLYIGISETLPCSFKTWLSNNTAYI